MIVQRKWVTGVIGGFWVWTVFMLCFFFLAVASEATGLVVGLSLLAFLAGVAALAICYSILYAKQNKFVPDVELQRMEQEQQKESDEPDELEPEKADPKPNELVDTRSDPPETFK